MHATWSYVYGSLQREAESKCFTKAQWHQRFTSSSLNGVLLSVSCQHVSWPLTNTNLCCSAPFLISPPPSSPCPFCCSTLLSLFIPSFSSSVVTIATLPLRFSALTHTTCSLTAPVWSHPAQHGRNMLAPYGAFPIGVMYLGQLVGAGEDAS